MRLFFGETELQRLVTRRMRQCPNQQTPAKFEPARDFQNQAVIPRESRPAIFLTQPPPKR
jgi:hypothetical protein